jgi:hypothetical protein
MNKFCIEVSNDELLIDVDYENAEIMVLGFLQAIKTNPELKDILVAVIELEEELEEYDDEELDSIEEE